MLTSLSFCSLRRGSDPGAGFGDLTHASCAFGSDAAFLSVDTGLENLPAEIAALLWLSRVADTSVVDGMEKAFSSFDCFVFPFSRLRALDNLDIFADDGMVDVPVREIKEDRTGVADL